MRAFVLAALLLASFSLASSVQGEESPPSAPQSVPGQSAPPDPKAQQPPDQRTDRGQSKGDNREMAPDWRMRRGDGYRAGRDDREVGHDMRGGNRDEYQDRDKDWGRYSDRDRRDDGDRMGRGDRDVGQYMRRGDHDEYRDRDKDRGLYGDRDDRENRGWDRADRDYRSPDEVRPRRRVKVCIEYDNGDEYCRYRQGR
jgi:hypothetical protein